LSGGLFAAAMFQPGCYIWPAGMVNYLLLPFAGDSTKI